MFDYLELMENRYSSKDYLDKEICDDDLNYILNCGRLSASSFGLEPWHFNIVRTPSFKKELRSACFDQISMRNSAFSIVVTAPIGDLDIDGDFIRLRGMRFPGDINEFIEDLRPYYYSLKETNALKPWLKSQAYIALTNMINAACSKGILSCYIEGFDNDKVLNVLSLDKDKYMVSLIATFGYPKDENRKKIRQELKDLVTYY